MASFTIAPIEISMKNKMKAAVVVQFGKPLEFQEWDIPTPGPGQILVKTEACGVCHTDVHAWHGDWPVKPTLPFIPGHEAIGPVVAVGSGVTAVKLLLNPPKSGVRRGKKKRLAANAD